MPRDFKAHVDNAARQASIPRKEGLSQNFLSDEGVIERFAGLAFDGRATMAGTADASDPDGHRLVELGPGLGAVTQALQHGGANSKMTAVELDRQVLHVPEYSMQSW